MDDRRLTGFSLFACNLCRLVRYTDMRLLITLLILLGASCSASRNAPIAYNAPPSTVKTFKDMDLDGNGTISIGEFDSFPAAHAVDSKGPTYVFLAIFLMVMLLCIGSSIRRFRKNG